jgi:hypothetical protein
MVGNGGRGVMRLEDLRGPQCAECGADIEHKRAHAIYCSRSCKDAVRRRLESEARAEARQGKTCAVCGIPFVARRPERLYCSRSCTDKAHLARKVAARPERACVVCGTPFRPMGVAREAKTCSRPCAVVLWRATRGCPSGSTAVPLGVRPRRPRSRR